MDNAFEKPIVETAELTTETAPVKTDTQQGGAEKTAAETTTTQVPFHKDPEVQRYIERQLSKREDGFKKEIEGLKSGYVKQLEALTQKNSSPSTTTPEQEQAVQMLVKAMSPALRKELGLDKINELETRLSSMSEEGSRSAFQSELEGVIKNYSEEYGYEKTELEDNLRDFMQNDEWFADKPYTKGSIVKAAKLYFADKVQELGQRKANLMLIKEQKEKKQASTESASSKTSKSNSKAKNLSDFLDERLNESGGLSFELS